MDAKRKYKLIYFVLFFLTLLGWQRSLSAVDPLTGAFLDTAVDWKDPQSTFELKRFYSSRSLWEGFFGFGWCSPLETFLEKQSSGKIAFKSCLDDVLFVPTDRKNSFASSQSIFSNWKLKLKNQNYVVTTPENEIYFFNLKGELNEVRRSPYRLHLKRPTKNRLFVKINFGSEIRFDLDPHTGHVKTIKFDDRQIATYEYHESHLASVKNFKGQNHYETNAAFNLIRIESGDGRQTRIRYDDDRDLVLEVVESIGCQTKLAYHIEKKKAYVTESADENSSCSGQLASRQWISRYAIQDDDSLVLLGVQVKEQKPIRRQAGSKGDNLE